MAIFSGLAVTVFSPGSDMLADWDTFTLNIENDCHDGAAGNDAWAYNVVGKGRWTLEADTFVATNAPIMIAAYSSAPTGTLQITFQGNTSYTTHAATGLYTIKRADHKVDEGLQKCSFTLEGAGALTVT